MTKYSSDETLPSSLNILQYNEDDLGSPDRVLTISFTKKESLNFNVKSTENVCLLNPDWELIPMKRGLKAEGSACYSTLLVNTLGTTSKPTV